MQEEQLLEISGSVEQIVFRNEKNGYTILEINDGRELVTLVRNCALWESGCGILPSGLNLR